MASFEELTPADIIETPAVIIETPADIIQDIHRRTVLQIPAEITQIPELPPQTGSAIQTGSEGSASGYRSIYNGKSVVVKQINVLSKIRNNILSKKQLPPKIIEESKKYIITGLLNEIVNYYKVSQITKHFFCRFIGYKIEYELTVGLESSTFIVSIVMDDCGEQDLFDFSGELFVNNTKTYYERVNILCSIFGHLLFDLMILHNNGFVHLDLKPENIFIKTNPGVLSLDEQYTVLLGDAGGLTKVGETKYVDGPIGSPKYIAPEVLNTQVKNDYNLKGADIYSVFITIFKILEDYKKNIKFIQYEIFNKLFGDYDASTFKKPGIHSWIEMIINSRPYDRPDIDTLVTLFGNNKSQRYGGARGRTKTHRSSKKGHKKRGTQKTNRLRRR